MSKVEIVSAGLLCADIIVKPVDKLPETGTADVVERLEISCGGCALNTGIILKKLGLSVALIGKVGEDTFGDFLICQVNQFGFNSQDVKSDPGNQTTSALVMISSSGERSFMYVPGSSERLSFQDFDFDLIAQAEMLHIGGIMKLTDLKAAEVFEKAKGLGIVTSLDTDWDASGKWLELIEDSLAYTDIFLSNMEEAKLISNEETPHEISRFFLNRGIKTLVLKMGEKGCYIRTPNDEYTIPAYKVKVVDTTGAGDAFVAGFLAGYRKGWDLEKCGKFANACGALCTTEIGTIHGIRDLSSTLTFMETAKKMDQA